MILDRYHPYVQTKRCLFGFKLHKIFNELLKKGLQGMNSLNDCVPIMVYVKSSRKIKFQILIFNHLE